MANIKKLSMAMIGAAFVALAIGNTAQATTIYTNPKNGHKYFLTDSGTWYDASSQAFFKFGSGNLVTINDQAEQDWLWKKFGIPSGQDKAFWIGLTRDGNSNNFSWLNGEDSDYRFWWPGEPNNAGGIEKFGIWNHVAGVDRDPALWGAWNDLDISAQAHGIAEINPLVTPLSGGIASLIFQANGDKRVPGAWDHVGLAFNGWVYESTQAMDYKQENNWDSNLGAYVDVIHKDGLQNSRSIQVLKQWSKAKNIGLPDEIPIDYELGYKMAELIGKNLDAGYQHLTLADSFKMRFHREKQKGKDGLFSCVGLIEWAAEQVGHNGGQGFIPNNREYINVGLFRHFNAITPWLQYQAVIHPDAFFKPRSWLQIITDPVDFILTDPLGRRLGYTTELGLVNEIAEGFYTGDGWAEQAYIYDLVSGDYTLELFGLDDYASVAFGNSTNGTLFEGVLAKGEKRTIVFKVPEPSSVLGLLTVGTFSVGSLLKRKHRQKGQDSNLS